MSTSIPNILRRGLRKYGGTLTNVPTGAPSPAANLGGVTSGGGRGSLGNSGGMRLGGGPPGLNLEAKPLQPATTRPALRGSNVYTIRNSDVTDAINNLRRADQTAAAAQNNAAGGAATGQPATMQAQLPGGPPQTPANALPTTAGGPPQTPANALPTTAGGPPTTPAPVSPGASGSILPDNFGASVGADQPMPADPTATSNMAGQAGAQMDQQRLNAAIDQEKATNPTGMPTQSELGQAQLTERLNDPKLSPQEKQTAARDYVQGIVNSDPELKQGLTDLQSGKDTPAAKAFQGRIDQAGNSFVSQEFQRLMAERQAQTGAPPTTQEQGGFFQQAMDGWNNMSGPMKMMMGLGLGVGVIGLMSSMFGEGGGGMGLLGLLGLGAAGIGGAMGGMFGEGAQSGINNMLLDAGSAMGVVPGKQDLSMLMADDPVAAAANRGGGNSLMPGWAQGTAAAKAQLAKAEQQRGQLQQLAGLPASLRNSLLMRMDPTNIKSVADAERAFANSQQILGAFDDPNSAIGKQLADGRAYVDGGQTWAGRLGQGVDTAQQIGTEFGNFASNPMGYAQQAGAATRKAISDWWNSGSEKQNAFHQHDHIVRYLVAQWSNGGARVKQAFNAMDAKELHDLQALQARTQKYDLKNSRRLHELQKRKMSQPPSGQREKIIVLCQKAARCWAGYEPVPGKAPYAEDSCRPAGSKKKPAPKKKSDK